MSKLISIQKVPNPTFESITIELSWKEAAFLRNLLGAHVSDHTITAGLLKTLKETGHLDNYLNEKGLKLRGSVYFVSE